jgi:hypothetical protein
MHAQFGDGAAISADVAPVWRSALHMTVQAAGADPGRFTTVELARNAVPPS